MITKSIGVNDAHWYLDGVLCATMRKEPLLQNRAKFHIVCGSLDASGTEQLTEVCKEATQLIGEWNAQTEADELAEQAQEQAQEQEQAQAQAQAEVTKLAELSIDNSSACGTIGHQMTPTDSRCNASI